MAIKRTWNLVRAGVNTVLANVYRDNAPGEDRYAVVMRFTVDGGPQHGRDVEWLLTPEEALAYAETLRNQAEHTARRNREA